MTITYRIHEKSGIVRIQLSGTLHLNEMVRTVEELLGDPRIQPGMNILSDHSRVQEVATMEFVGATIPLLGHLAEHLGAFRCAVVTTRAGSQRMTKLAAVLAERTGAEVRAFRTLDEPESWLSARTPPPHPGVSADPSAPRPPALPGKRSRADRPIQPRGSPR